MADADKILLSRNDLDLIVDKTTGRIAWVVKATDGTHATVERGYTGVRDITGLMTGITAGKVTVARDGATVTWGFHDVVTSGGDVTLATSQIAALAMFTPETDTYTEPITRGATGARIAVAFNGLIKMYATIAGTGHNAVITHTTGRAWGATLPGVGNGTGVVYL